MTRFEVFNWIIWPIYNWNIVVDYKWMDTQTGKQITVICISIVYMCSMVFQPFGSTKQSINLMLTVNDFYTTSTWPLITN